MKIFWIFCLVLVSTLSVFSSRAEPKYGGWFSDAVQTAKEKANKAIDVIVEIPKKVEKFVEEEVTSLIKTVKNAITGTTKLIKGTFNSTEYFMLTTMQNMHVINNKSLTFKDIKNSIGDAITEGVQDIKTGFDNAAAHLKMPNSIKLHNLSSTLQTVSSEVRQAFSDVIKNPKLTNGTIEDFVSAMKSRISGATTGVEDLAKQFYSVAKNINITSIDAQNLFKLISSPLNIDSASLLEETNKIISNLKNYDPNLHLDLFLPFKNRIGRILSELKNATSIINSGLQIVENKWQETVIGINSLSTDVTSAVTTTAVPKCLNVFGGAIKNFTSAAMRNSGQCITNEKNLFSSDIEQIKILAVTGDSALSLSRFTLNFILSIIAASQKVMTDVLNSGSRLIACEQVAQTLTLVDVVEITTNLAQCLQ